MERAAEGPKKLNVLHDRRNIPGTRSGCPAAIAKLYPVLAPRCRPSRYAIKSAVEAWCIFAPAIWLYAGHTLLIATVGLRLVFITPHLELGDHLRHRQMRSQLIVSSLLAIAAGAMGTRPELCRAAAETVGAPGGGA
jgi:hypothetical protein